MNSQLQNKLLRDTLLDRNKVIYWALKSVWRILSEGEADCFIYAKGEKGDFDFLGKDVHCMLQHWIHHGSFGPMFGRNEWCFYV